MMYEDMTAAIATARHWGKVQRVLMHISRGLAGGEAGVTVAHGGVVAEFGVRDPAGLESLCRWASSELATARADVCREAAAVAAEREGS